MRYQDVEGRTWHAVWKATRGCCPNCGKGKLYKGYLEFRDHCDVCGTKFRLHNVGLLLSFALIMITAHIIIFVMLDLELRGGGSVGMYLAILVPLSVIIPLALARYVKGAIFGLLWVKNFSDEQ